MLPSLPAGLHPPISAESQLRMFACVCKLMPTMSPCPSTLQRIPLVCLGLLCLLLPLTDSTVSKKGPTQVLNTTQANCSAALIAGVVCSPGDNGDVGENATDLQLKGHLKGKQKDQFPNNSSLSTSHTSVSHALSSSVALTQPSTVTGSPTQAAHTDAATTAATQPVGNVVPAVSLGTSATTTAPPSAATTATSTTLMTTKTTAITTQTSAATTATSTTLMTTKTTAITTPSAATTATSTTPPTTPTSTAAATAPPPATSVKARTRLTTANPTVAMTTTTGTKISSAATPHHALSTGKPPIQTSLPTGPTTITTTSPSTPTGRSAPVAPGPRVPVVDVAGAPLTKQLVDTASLLSVLLFGLLFFLVTVAVFVTQAYDSYRRKDYTQVDYLINGMYSDSGV
ncbi:uncharacterized protein C11orf24 isoform X2 [Sander lucioperca]|uniref:uncharacterized protein C11orf24 isoform X2 n=1 Tax=Sander lucioperca TaxID=283035 RepID=UPI00125DD089|nr:uncharacterized protein C11orf24 isoform X2 [Sander lucioperca]